MKTNWNYILDTLSRQKCVFFLGTEIFTDNQGNTIEKALVDFLKEDEIIHSFIRKYYPEEGLFLFEKKSHKRQVISKMREFYQSNNIPSLDHIKKIAEIPFHLCLNLNPNHLLIDHFKSKGFPYEHDYYFKMHPPQKQFIKPTKDKPLIYHILGDIEVDESLILTHNDLFNYLRSVFKETSMSDELKQELIQSNCFIFFGLPFEKWYMQLILNIFDFKSVDYDELERYALRNIKHEKIEEFFREQFHFEFVAEDIGSFIDDLHQRCKEKGILRTSSEISTSIAITSNSIKTLIGKAKRDEAISILKQRLETQRPASNSLLDELSVISARSELLQMQKRLNTISFENENLEENQINVSLLSLVNAANI